MNEEHNVCGDFMQIQQRPAMRVASFPRVTPAFHVLAKPTAAACNLACSYCFFLDKELLYPDSRFRMTEETLWPQEIPTATFTCLNAPPGIRG